MQHNGSKTNDSPTMSHPQESEWMDFLYEEVSPTRKREMQEHLRDCSLCSEQVQAWKGGMRALDDYRLPVFARHRKSHFAPVLRWAAAAAVILAAGFALGRVSSTSDRQIQELRASVAQLQQASTARAHESAILASATQAANEETLRLLNEFTRVTNLQKTQERQATVLALRALEQEYLNLRSGLEILAVNTEDGLQTTHQNLARLAAYSASQPDN